MIYLTLLTLVQRIHQFFNCKVLTMLTLGTLQFSNSSNSSSSIFQSNIFRNEDIDPTSLVIQPISNSQSISNTDVTNTAFQQSIVTGSSGSLTSLTPSLNPIHRNWADITNSSISSMPSLISASDSSMAIRLTDQNATVINNIDLCPPSVTAIAPQVPRTDYLMVLLLLLVHQPSVKQSSTLLASMVGILRIMFVWSS